MTDEEYPFRVYEKEDLQKCYKKLQDALRIYKPELNLPRKFVGMACADAFFQYERLATGGQGKKSPIEAWKDPRIRAHVKKQATRINYQRLQDALRLFLPMMCKQFHPFQAGAIYKYFDAKSVFDPYAGWGDRCVAAMAMGIPYTGVDSNPNLVGPYQNMIKFYSATNTVFINDKSENVAIEKLDFDVVLTSPPFWKDKNKKMIETYNGAETNFTKFMETSMIPVMKRCLQKGKWFCLYIPNDMFEDLVKIFGPADLIFVTAFQSSKIHKQTQNKCIYCWKGK